MAYRFKTKESFAKGFRRIVAEQIGAAEQRLSQSTIDPTNVHEARKNLKRTRALLRLMRPALGDELFKRENARLRDAGALLSARRDAHVLDQTLVNLGPEPDSALAPTVSKLRAAVASTRTDVDASSEQQSLANAAEELRQSLSALRRQKFKDDGFDLVEPGLKRSYAAARKAMRVAYAEPSEENFHEWRKGIQQHWRQMLLLSRGWPEVLLPRARAARQISEMLGQDHDIAVLKAYLHSHSDLPLTPRERQNIEAHFQGQQASLRARCKPLGERLLAERSRSFSRRVETYWRVAGQIENAAVEAELSAKAKVEAAEKQVARADRGGKAA